MAFFLGRIPESAARFSRWSAVLALCWLLTSGGGPRAQETRKMTPEEIEQIELGAGCITAECHTEMGKKKFLHGPMNFGKCEPCHTPIGNKHRFQKSPVGRGLCLLCHELEPPKKVQHKPFAEDCTLCHVQHESDTRYFVKGGTGADGCLQNCHKDFSLKHAFLHAPVERGGCLACHTTHQSDHEKLLTHDPQDLCVLCHVDFPERIQAAPEIHEPVRKEKCTACHLPHGGETKFLVPADEKELCVKCHADFFAEVKNLSFPHTGMTDQQTCRHCHEPHTATRQYLLSAPVADLCLECHDRPVPEDGRTLSDIMEQIRNATSRHGPIRQKDCSPCHLPHGSDVRDLLNKPFPNSFYVSFYHGVFENCFHCHDQRIIQEEFSARTEYRNGDWNLHFVHVNREKGRSCRVCHEEHASPQLKLMRSKIAYGDWELPLEFTETPTGGGCQTGCHEPFRYDRASPVVNKMEIPPLGGTGHEPPRKPQPAPTVIPAKFEARIVPSPALSALVAGKTAPTFLFLDEGENLQHLGEGDSPTLLLFVNAGDATTSPCLGALNRALGETPQTGTGIRRWILFPAGTGAKEMDRVRRIAGRGWTALLDGEDRLFSSYRVTMTPATVLVGPPGRIYYAKAGYDLRNAEAVRREAAELLKRKTEGVAAPIAPTRLTLQLARRLAARGLWENALKYYLEVQGKEGLSSLARIELAEVYLELRQPDPALEILKGITPDSSQEDRVTGLLKRAAEIKAGAPEKISPPAVTR